MAWKAVEKPITKANFYLRLRRLLNDMRTRHVDNLIKNGTKKHLLVNSNASPINTSQVNTAISSITQNSNPSDDVYYSVDFYNNYS